MSKNIKISEKHGLNPSIDVCFFCGKDKQLLLFGKLKGDAKAPTRVVSNYVPCEECRKKFAEGRLVIEVVTKDNGVQPITAGAWPTGRWCVLPNEIANVLFKGIPNPAVLLETELFDAMMNRKKQIN